MLTQDEINKEAAQAIFKKAYAEVQGRAEYVLAVNYSNLPNWLHEMRTNLDRMEAAAQLYAGKTS